MKLTKCIKEQRNIMKKLLNIKLKSGTQLVTEVAEEKPLEGFWLLKEPMVVGLVPNQKENKTEVTLYPYLVEIAQNKDVGLNVSEIEAMAEVSLEMEKYYLQLTSGIDLTTKIK
jgi:hypothetical protein